MRVEQWNGAKFPLGAVDILREGLLELLETEDEVFMSLDRATSDRNLTFIASDGEQPIGVLIALPKPRIHSAFVLWIIVAPHARRRGVGTALVDALEATPGLAGLDGMVDQEDSATRGFWRHRGWKVSETRPGPRQHMEFWLPTGTAEAA